jgi:para-nitrobenzyl esterase
MRSLASAESIAIEYAGAHGITGDNQTVLAGLRALSTDDLTKGVDQYALAIFGGPEILGLSHSIIDGRLVVEAPEVALRAGRVANVPVIVGANDHDMAVSPAETKDALFSMFGAQSSQARELYDPSGSESLDDLRQSVCSDLEMMEPTSNLAECVAKAGQPAYFYRFGYVPEALRAAMPGALHAGELIFVFDSVPVLLKDQATAADFAMARTMSGYWVDFVKTGNPNGGGRVAWPSYDPAQRDVLNITKTGGVSFGRDPLRERLDLWRNVWESCP